MKKKHKINFNKKRFLLFGSFSLALVAGVVISSTLATFGFKSKTQKNITPVDPTLITNQNTSSKPKPSLPASPNPDVSTNQPKPSLPASPNPDVSTNQPKPSLPASNPDTLNKPKPSLPNQTTDPSSDMGFPFYMVNGAETTYSLSELLAKAVFPTREFLAQFRSLSNEDKAFYSSSNYKLLLERNKLRNLIKLDFIRLKKLTYETVWDLLAPTSDQQKSFYGFIDKNDYAYGKYINSKGLSSFGFNHEEEGIYANKWSKVRAAIVEYAQLEYNFKIIQAFDYLISFYDNFKKQIQNLIGLFAQEIQQNKLNDYIEAIRLGYNIAFPFIQDSNNKSNQLYETFYIKIPQKLQEQPIDYSVFTSVKIKAYLKKWQSELNKLKPQAFSELKTRIERLQLDSKKISLLQQQEIEVKNFTNYWKEFMAWQTKALADIQAKGWLSKKQQEANTAFLEEIYKKEWVNLTIDTTNNKEN